MTVYDYVQKGVFSGDGKVFRLSNSDKINSRWRNKAFTELSVDDQRKIRSTTIHAIVFEQKKPENNDTSMYQVFERINTSGRTLTPQEIRNCVYQGSFNKLLFELNELDAWRKLYGSASPDSRMRDLECILRFFVMKSSIVQETESVQITLKKCFNDFMGNERNANPDTIERFRNEFTQTMNGILRIVGDNAFRNYSKGKFTSKFNPALFDAVAVAFYQLQQEGIDIQNLDQQAHQRLFENDEFVKACKQRTTDIVNIKKRISIVRSLLCGEECTDEN